MKRRRDGFAALCALLCACLALRGSAAQSASSSSGSSPGAAFDQSGATQWESSAGSYPLPATLAAPGIYGEWVQLTPAAPLRLVGYSLTAGSPAPQSWALLGSADDGCSWTVLDSSAAPLAPGGTFSKNVSAYASALRLVCVSSAGASCAVAEFSAAGEGGPFTLTGPGLPSGSTSGNATLAVDGNAGTAWSSASPGAWVQVGLGGPSVVKGYSVLQLSPPSPWTLFASADSGVSWTVVDQADAAAAAASVGASANRNVSSLGPFNVVRLVCQSACSVAELSVQGVPASAPAWSSAPLYSAGTGAYAGSTVTSGVAGEWAQIQTPALVATSSYSLTTSSFGAPSSWTLLASVDGASWLAVASEAALSLIPNTDYTFPLANAAAPAQFFRFVCEATSAGSPSCSVAGLAVYGGSSPLATPAAIFASAAVRGYAGPVLVASGGGSQHVLSDVGDGILRLPNGTAFQLWQPAATVVALVDQTGSGTFLNGSAALVASGGGPLVLSVQSQFLATQAVSGAAVWAEYLPTAASGTVFGSQASGVGLRLEGLPGSSLSSDLLSNATGVRFNGGTQATALLGTWSRLAANVSLTVDAAGYGGYAGYLSEISVFSAALPDAQVAALFADSQSFDSSPPPLPPRPPPPSPPPPSPRPPPSPPTYAVVPPRPLLSSPEMIGALTYFALSSSGEDPPLGAFGPDGWTSDADAYSASTGAYVGAEPDGGEWVEIDLAGGASLVPMTYSFSASAGAHVVLVAQAALSGGAQQTIGNATSSPASVFQNASGPFSLFKLVCVSVAPPATSCLLANFSVGGNLVMPAPPTPPSPPSPLEEFASTYLASSTASGSGATRVADRNGLTFWSPDPNATAHVTVSEYGGSTVGEWVQVVFSTPSQQTSFGVTAGPSGPPSGGFALFGSLSGGQTWVPIATGTSGTLNDTFVDAIRLVCVGTPCSVAEFSYDGVVGGAAFSFVGASSATGGNASAAVDGSVATAWAAGPNGGALSAFLGRPVLPTSVAVVYPNDATPALWNVSGSSNGGVQWSFGLANVSASGTAGLASASLAWQDAGALDSLRLATDAADAQISELSLTGVPASRYEPSLLLFLQKKNIFNKKLFFF